MENSLITTTLYTILDTNSNNKLQTVQNVTVDQQQKIKIFIPSDDPFLTDLWIGFILILMVLICIGYICTCLLYHKFRRWKREVLEAQRTLNVRNSFHEGYAYEESLPSYTIVTGLPSYDQAMEQFRQLRVIRVSNPKLTDVEENQNTMSRIALARLSLGELFQFHKNDRTLTA